MSALSRTEVQDMIDADRSGIEVRLIAIESKLDKGLAEIRGEFKSEMAAMEARIVKWVAGAMLANLTLSIAMMTYFANTAQRPVQNASAPAPVTIYFPAPAPAPAK